MSICVLGGADRLKLGVETEQPAETTPASMEGGDLARDKNKFITVLEQVKKTF